jgi:hypothetical protein
MSYIRSTSNPEALYIWDDGTMANVSHGVPKPHSSETLFRIPSAVFRKCLKKWDGSGDPVSFQGMTVEELNVDRKTAKTIPPASPCRRGCKKEGNGFIPCKRCSRRFWKDIRRGKYVIRLSYKKDFVDLWRVTWDYVAKHP